MLAFVPSLTETEVTKELETLKAIIVKSGSIFHEQVWGKRDLYYKLGDQVKAIYAVLSFTSTSNPHSLNNDLRHMAHVLRYRLGSLPADYEVKPHMMIEEDKKLRPEEKRGAPVIHQREYEKKPIRKSPGVHERKVEDVPVEKMPVKEPVVSDKIVLDDTPVAAVEEPKTKAKKKSSFDDKIDEIIENLDKI